MARPWKHLVLSVSSVLLVWRSRALSQPSVGDEFRVNSYSTGIQFNTQIAVQSGGSFVVAWDNLLDVDYGPSTMVVRRFAADGTPLTDEIDVAPPQSGDEAVVASGADGSFVVSWNAIDGSGYGVFARRFDSAGAAIGAEFRVNTQTYFSQYNPSIASDRDGNFIVVWQTNGPIMGATFWADGSPRVTDFRVNSTSGAKGWPTVAADAAGNFVVEWSALSSQVEARRFDGEANPIGEDFQVAMDAAVSQASVSVSPSGSFAVVWAVPETNVGRWLNARVFRSNGEAGSAFRIDTGALTSHIGPPKVSLDDSGVLFVAWEEPFLAAVSARAYRADGTPIGSMFRLSDATAGGAQLPRVASLGTGRFVAVWSSAWANEWQEEAVGRIYSFLPKGDANADGVFDLYDVFYLINALFAGGPPPLGPADPNGDGVLDVWDVFYLINSLFANGPAPTG